MIFDGIIQFREFVFLLFRLNLLRLKPRKGKGDTSCAHSGNLARPEIIVSITVLQG